MRQYGKHRKNLQRAKNRINSFNVFFSSSSAFLHIAYDKSYEQGYSAPYLRPFSESLWIGISFWVIISGLIIIIINYTAYRLKLHTRFVLISSMFLGYESFTNQCGSKIPGSSASRTALITTRLAPWFVVSVYSAAILSFVTVKIFTLPFTDLKGLIRDGSFKIGYENHTFFSLIFNVRQTECTCKTAFSTFLYYCRM